jgi:hypothetical protein
MAAPLDKQVNREDVDSMQAFIGVGPPHFDVNLYEAKKNTARTWPGAFSHPC